MWWGVWWGVWWGGVVGGVCGECGWGVGCGGLCGGGVVHFTFVVSVGGVWGVVGGSVVGVHCLWCGSLYFFVVIVCFYPSKLSSLYFRALCRPVAVVGLQQMTHGFIPHAAVAFLLGQRR